MDWFSFLHDDEKTTLITRLQSFLKWVANENPDYQEALTSEELATCYLQDFKHPPEIELLLNGAKGFQVISHLHEYVNTYFDQAARCELTEAPVLKTNPKTPTVYIPSSGGITEPQFKYLQRLLKTHKQECPNILQLSKKEASQMIDELLKKKPS
ncbi:hypothetical protein ACFYKX_10180 [Cytobacillus sp. FJAT-54145]|uniref:Uncharacterized protein n=1 Tax=Cytobacillus spartinae TaxID=3299023 RepID=A0ABW6K9Z3_9BACI